MPEGPEVRRCRDIVSDVLTGKSIKALEPVSGKLLRNGISVKGSDPFTVQQPDSPVVDVTVKGKVIFIDLGEKTIVSTLGMSGWWYPDSSQLSSHLENQSAHYNNQEVKIKEVISLAEKYVRARIVCTDGTILNYSDMRNFGNLYVTDKRGADAKRAELGPDLLNDGVSFEDWRAGWSNSKLADQPIGAALLNQKIFCGLGNIYRAEALYIAGIDPFLEIKYLTPDDLNRLLIAATYVLDSSYRRDGAIAYQVKFLKRIFSPERYLKLQEEIEGSRVYGKINWEGFEEMAYYGKVAVYSQQKSMLGENVKRSTLGGRTIWHV